MNTRLLPVLAAEDEDSDRLILSLGFQRAGLRNPLVVVKDGQEAMEYLAGAGCYGDRETYPLPALLLLDLKMPRMSGFDVMAWVAARPEFRRIPLVVLSSSSDASDMERARQMGAAEYLVKPHAFSDLVNMIRSLEKRWLSTSETEE